MRILGIILCLAALGLTGFSALTYKAPEIEADLEARTADMLAGMGSDDITVTADGRRILLDGRVTGDQRKTEILQAVARVPGVLESVDSLEVVNVTSPYTFEAVKEESGRVIVQGLAPTGELKALIEDDIQSIFGPDAAVSIAIAAGAPEGNWGAAVVSSLDALATTNHGRLAITGTDVALEGVVASEADAEAIDIFAEALPADFAWASDIAVEPARAEPFTFSVVKDPETGLHLEGFAPDEATRTALIDQAKAIGGDKPVIADIQIAEGMPDAEWPALVQAGIGAMKEMESGQFDVIDNDVSFSSDPEAAVGKAALAAAAADTDAEAVPETEVALDIEGAGDDVAALTDETPGTATPEPKADGPADAALAPSAVEPEPLTPVLTVDKVENGVWSVRGTVPDAGSEATLLAVIQDQAGVERVEAEIQVAGSAPNDAWLRHAADRVRTLNEVEAGRLNLKDFDTHFIGVVETADDVEPVQTALAAIDRDMTVDLQPIDPRRTASLHLSLSADSRVFLSGALPEGLSEEDLLRALGIRQYEGRLDENGRGSAELWQSALAEIGAILPAFEAIDLSLDDDRPVIKGQLHAYYDPDTVAADLAVALGEGNNAVIDVETTKADYEEGAERTSPLTGEPQFYQQGYWLPVVSITATKETCGDGAGTLLSQDKITFLRGEATLDRQAERTLSALASLAIACLENEDLTLEIGGHTDARGAAEMNQALSQARADAVRNALTARGVAEDRLTAVGYGAAQPIADNTTDEGRAANRRITFEWKTSADG